MNPPPLGPNSMGHVPCKKLKQGHMTVSASPQYLTFAQPSSTAVQLPAKHARDDQLGRKGTLFSPQSNGQALGPVNPNVQPNKVKARGSLIVQASKKGFVHSGVDILKPGSDIIEILATDKLIHEVERVCGGENPEPALVQRAKLILKDHERALLEAIGKLADVSDGDDTPDRIQYMIQEPQSRAHVFPNNRSRSHCK